MYSIVLKNGKIINVNADSSDWFNESKTLILHNGEVTVGIFNIDNIAGFTKSDCMAESEDKE